MRSVLSEVLVVLVLLPIYPALVAIVLVQSHFVFESQLLDVAVVGILPAVSKTHVVGRFAVGSVVVELKEK